MTVVADQLQTKTPQQEYSKWVKVSLQTTFWVILSVGLCIGSQTQRADETIPECYSVKPQGELMRETIHVGTFNIHSGKGTDGAKDLNRIAELIEPLDLVGLNEVSAGFGHDQVRQLCSIHDRIGLFAPTEKKWWQHHFGNGLLAQVDVERGIVVPLPATHKKYRNIIWSRLEMNGHTVQVLVCHIDRTKDRYLQLKHVLRLFKSINSPAILMGDLNTKRNEELLQELFRKDGSITDVLADARYADMQDKHIDWIITKGFETVSAELKRTVASDHPLLWAELKLKTNE